LSGADDGAVSPILNPDCFPFWNAISIKVPSPANPRTWCSAARVLARQMLREAAFCTAERDADHNQVVPAITFATSFHREFAKRIPAME
jgi:hypothetical protein